MKKTLFLIIILLFTAVIVSAKEVVSFSKCVDGDTAYLIKNGKEIKVRFLAVDTPETKHPTKGEEPFGKEASTFNCDALKSADKIEIEYDNNSDKKDKYDRELVWIFTDNKLLQESLIEKGLAKVDYLYGDYKYTDLLLQKEKEAKNNKLGIWSDYEGINYIFVILVVIIFILLICFSSKFRKKTKSKIKRKLKTSINKEIKKILKK